MGEQQCSIPCLPVLLLHSHTPCASHTIPTPAPPPHTRPLPLVTPLCALWMAGHCTAVLLSHPWHVTQEFSCFLHILVLSEVEFPSTGKKFVAQIKITPGSKSPFFLICSNHNSYQLRFFSLPYQFGLGSHLHK